MNRRAFLRGAIALFSVGSAVGEKVATIISKNKDIAWYLVGKFHRADEPATDCSDRTKRWYMNTEFHRTDGPFVEPSDESTKWYHSIEDK